MTTKKNDATPGSEALVERLTKKLADEGKLIEAGWMGYLIAVIPADALPVQIEESKLCFFAGAQHLFASIMTMLDPGDEPTGDDLDKIDLIEKELAAFAESLTRRIQTVGRA
jgi:hypothetical protein